MSKNFTKKCSFLFFSIYDENFHLLRSGDKKTAPCEGAVGKDLINFNSLVLNEYQYLLLRTLLLHDRLLAFH